MIHAVFTRGMAHAHDLDDAIDAVGCPIVWQERKEHRLPVDPLTLHCM